MINAIYGMNTKNYNHTYNGDHGLSQQGVWVSFWTPKPLKRFVKNFLKCQSQAYNWIVLTPYNSYDIV